MYDVCSYKMTARGSGVVEALILMGDEMNDIEPCETCGELRDEIADLKDELKEAEKQLELLAETEERTNALEEAVNDCGRTLADVCDYLTWKR